jgi:hypothetical protein
MKSLSVQGKGVEPRIEWRCSIVGDEKSAMRSWYFVLRQIESLEASSQLTIEIISHSNSVLVMCLGAQGIPTLRFNH